MLGRLAGKSCELKGRDHHDTLYYELVHAQRNSEGGRCRDQSSLADITGDSNVVGDENTAQTVKAETGGSIHNVTQIAGDVVFQLYAQAPALSAHIRVREFQSLVAERTQEFVGRELSSRRSTTCWAIPSSLRVHRHQWRAWHRQDGTDRATGQADGTCITSTLVRRTSVRPRTFWATCARS